MNEMISAPRLNGSLRQRKPPDLKREPMKHAEYHEKVTKKQIQLMHERGIWKKPER